MTIGNFATISETFETLKHNFLQYCNDVIDKKTYEANKKKNEKILKELYETIQNPANEIISY